MEKILLFIYAVPLLFIFSYSLVQLSLIINYWKSKRQPKKLLFDTQLQPKVTIQLPIYNEMYVVERLIDNISQIIYPKNLLEIQILDDSTDETSEIISRKVNELKNLGFDIQHIQRPTREGFKAGALAYGLNICKGDFIAIFDADFLPKPDFLQKTIPYFIDDKVGVVQSRWTHLNENYSLLTQLQAFGLDAHFTIEQSGRNYGNHFINFNGTAGIWRKTTIIDAGGWQSDTLTEDLDLSYRAQLKHWNFIYVEDLESPAELPVTMNAIKSQQYRWTKGAAECSVKNLKRLLRADDVSFSTKIHGFYHLMNSSVFVGVLLLALLSVPVLIIVSKTPIFAQYFRLTALFQISWLILGLFYWVGFSKKNLGFFEFLKRFPLFLIFMMGLSFHNSIAVLEAWIGKKTPFIRTPKFNIIQNNDEWKPNKYNNRQFSKSLFFELFLMSYFLIACFIDWHYHSLGMIPFHLMLFGGYFSIIYLSIIQSNYPTVSKAS